MASATSKAPHRKRHHRRQWVMPPSARLKAQSGLRVLLIFRDKVRLSVGGHAAACQSRQRTARPRWSAALRTQPTSRNASSYFAKYAPLMAVDAVSMNLLLCSQLGER